MPSAPQPDLKGIPRPGQLFQGKYRIVRVIGIGGMGAVLEAHHMHLDERVAIKILLAEHANDGEVVTRFVREARAAIRIKSEHIARVSDAGTTETGTPFMVMEYLEGADADAILEANGPFAVRRAVDLVLDACEALAQAHARGIVHRDLKPANLFVTMRGGAEVAKLLDFGISKHPTTGGPADYSMTKTRAQMGSPMYMSPEQMRSARDVDARADVWGLGTLLFTWLRGSPPFHADSMPELCAKILQDPTPPLSELRREVPGGLGAAVARCLEKTPSNRYQSVVEVARAISPYGSAASAKKLALVEGAPQPGDFSEPSIPSVSSSPTYKLPVLARTGATTWADTHITGSKIRSRTGRVLAGLGVVVMGALLVVFLLRPHLGTTLGSGRTEGSGAVAPSALVQALPSSEPPAPVASTSASTSSSATTSTVTPTSANNSPKPKPKPSHASHPAAPPPPPPSPPASTHPPAQPTAPSELANDRKG